VYPEGFVDRIGKLQHLRIFERLIILSEVENTHSVYFLREQFIMFYIAKSRVSVLVYGQSGIHRVADLLLSESKNRWY
jgi:hypothetical protein